MSRLVFILGVFCGLLLHLTDVSAQQRRSRSSEDDRQLSATRTAGVAGNWPVAFKTNAQRKAVRGKFKRRLVLRNKEKPHEVRIEDGFTYSFGFGSKGKISRIRAPQRPRQITAPDYDYYLTTLGEDIAASRGASDDFSKGAADVADGNVGMEASQNDGHSSPRLAVGSSTDRSELALADFTDYSGESTSLGIDLRSEKSTSPARRKSKRRCSRKSISCNRERTVAAPAREDSGSGGFFSRRLGIQTRRIHPRTGLRDTSDGVSWPEDGIEVGARRSFTAGTEEGREEQAAAFEESLRINQKQDTDDTSFINSDNTDIKTVPKVESTFGLEEAGILSPNQNASTTIAQFSVGKVKPTSAPKFQPDALSLKDEPTKQSEKVFIPRSPGNEKWMNTQEQREVHVAPVNDDDPMKESSVDGLSSSEDETTQSEDEINNKELLHEAVQAKEPIKTLSRSITARPKSPTEVGDKEKLLPVKKKKSKKCNKKEKTTQELDGTIVNSDIPPADSKGKAAVMMKNEQQPENQPNSMASEEPKQKRKSKKKSSKKNKVATESPPERSDVKALVTPLAVVEVESEKSVTSATLDVKTEEEGNVSDKHTQDPKEAISERSEDFGAESNQQPTESPGEVTPEADSLRKSEKQGDLTPYDKGLELSTAIKKQPEQAAETEDNESATPAASTVEQNTEESVPEAEKEVEELAEVLEEVLEASDDDEIEKNQGPKRPELDEGTPAMQQDMEERAPALEMKADEDVLVEPKEAAEDDGAESKKEHDKPQDEGNHGALENEQKKEENPSVFIQTMTEEPAEALDKPSEDPSTDTEVKISQLQEIPDEKQAEAVAVGQNIEKYASELEPKAEQHTGTIEEAMKVHSDNRTISNQQQEDHESENDHEAATEKIQQITEESAPLLDVKTEETADALQETLDEPKVENNRVENKLMQQEDPVEDQFEDTLSTVQAFEDVTEVTESTLEVKVKEPSKAPEVITEGPLNRTESINQEQEKPEAHQGTESSKTHEEEQNIEEGAPIFEMLKGLVPEEPTKISTDIRFGSDQIQEEPEGEEDPAPLVNFLLDTVEEVKEEDAPGLDAEVGWPTLVPEEANRNYSKVEITQKEQEAPAEIQLQETQTPTPDVLLKKNFEENVPGAMFEVGKPVDPLEGVIGVEKSIHRDEPTEIPAEGDQQSVTDVVKDQRTVEMNVRAELQDEVKRPSEAPNDHSKTDVLGAEISRNTEKHAETQAPAEAETSSAVVLVRHTNIQENSSAAALDVKNPDHTKSDNLEQINSGTTDIGRINWSQKEDKIADIIPPGNDGSLVKDAELRTPEQAQEAETPQQHLSK